MSASPAPAGKSPWSEYKNSEGRVYWSHSVTKQSVWEKPDELKTPFEKAVSKTQWKQYTSKNRPYYVHSVTKETKWDLPQELLDLKEKVDQQEAAKEERARRVAAGERSPTPIRGSESPDIQATRENAVARYRSPTPERERTPLEVITMPPGGFLTHDKAEEGFIYLLKRERVDETWTWDQTMRQIIMDPLYKALGTLAEKKAAFEKVTTADRIALTISTPKASSPIDKRPKRPDLPDSGHSSSSSLLRALTSSRTLQSRPRTRSLSRNGTGGKPLPRRGDFSWMNL